MLWNKTLIQNVQVNLLQIWKLSKNKKRKTSEKNFTPRQWNRRYSTGQRKRNLWPATKQLVCQSPATRSLKVRLINTVVLRSGAITLLHHEENSIHHPSTAALQIHEFVRIQRPWGKLLIAHLIYFSRQPINPADTALNCAISFVSALIKTAINHGKF